MDEERWRFIRYVLWPFVRDVLLFFGGMGGVYHETVLRSGERPSLQLLYGAMMGLPAFLKHGEDRNR